MTARAAPRTRCGSCTRSSDCSPTWGCRASRSGARRSTTGCAVAPRRRPRSGARRQVANVIRTYVLAAANGLTRMFWYRYDWAALAGGGTIGNTLLSTPGDPSHVTEAGQALAHHRAVAPRHAGRPGQQGAVPTGPAGDVHLRDPVRRRGAPDLLEPAPPREGAHASDRAVSPDGDRDTGRGRPRGQDAARLLPPGHGRVPTVNRRRARRGPRRDQLTAVRLW